MALKIIYYQMNIIVLFVNLKIKKKTKICVKCGYNNDEYFKNIKKIKNILKIFQKIYFIVKVN